MTTRRREPGPLARTLSRLRARAYPYLSRERLAELSGISVDNIASMEQGRSANPTLNTLLGLADALGVEVAELIQGVRQHREGDA